MTTAADVTERQIVRSGTTLLHAMEPLDADTFFAENPDGFSAAWVVGHQACVADLFSSWFDDGELLFTESFHQVFNETGIETGLTMMSKAATVSRSQYPKGLLLLRFRQGVSKALRVLRSFGVENWDSPGPPGTPVPLLTGGEVWEHLARHGDWHNGQLAGSMPVFFFTYTLNTLSHYFYEPPDT